MVDPTLPIALVDPTRLVPISLVDPTRLVTLVDPTSLLTLIDAGYTAVLGPSSLPLPLVDWTRPVPLSDSPILQPFGISQRLPSRRSSKSAGDLHRVDPWLRMVANGSSLVNAERARVSACVTTTKAPDAKSDLRRGPNARLAESQQLKPRPKLGLDEEHRATDASVNVFVEMLSNNTHSIAAVETLLKTPKRRGKLLSGRVSIADLKALSEHEAVRSVSRAQSLRFDQGLPRWPGNPKAPAAPLPPRSESDNNGVMIGLIDVGGFDFAHPDFLDSDGKTRFTAIWDMGAERGAKPTGFHYGTELKHAAL